MIPSAPLPSVAEIHRRLGLIFPEQVDPQGWVRRELAAKTVFVMLYGSAVEGNDRWIRPTAVTDMTDAQAAYRDEALANAIRFDLNVSGSLPDVILVDVEPEPPLIVFVECVISDGVVDERRRAELEALASRAGYGPADCAYVTAFPDRARSLFPRRSAALAWGSFAWFESEPDHIIFLRSGTEERSTSLARLLRT